MRYSLPSLLSALLLTRVVASAQTTKSTTETKVKADNGQVVTVTGCLMIGGGTNFLLAPTSERAEHEKVATSGSGPYALLDRDGVNLGRYINQRVELTGVVVPAATKGDADEKIKIQETTKVDADKGADKKASEKKTVKVARGADTQFVVATVKTLAPVCEQ